VKKYDFLIICCLLIQNIQLSCGSSAQHSLKFYEKNQEWKKAADYLERQKRIQPRNPDIYFWLGSVYLKLGTFDQAYQNFRKSLRLSSKHEKEIQNLLEAAFREQIRKADNVRGEAKLIYLRNAVILQPQNAKGNLYYGTELLRAGKPQQSIAYLELAVKKLPKNIQAHVHLAEAYFKTKNFDLSKKHLIEAFKLEPSNSNAHRTAGLLFLSQGRRKDAISHFEKSLSGKWDEALAIFALKLCMEEQEYAKAKSIAVRLCQQNPKNLSYVEALVDVLFKLREYANALPYIEKLLQIQPENMTYLQQKAIALYWLGDEREYQKIVQKLNRGQKLEK